MSQATLIRSSEKINRNVENMALSDFNTGGGGLHTGWKGTNSL